jgi:hypothetical protein
VPPLRVEALAAYCITVASHFADVLPLILVGLTGL